jgi:hypothetical protein
MPQKDPDYYLINTVNFNRPVFITDKVGIKAGTLARAAYFNKTDVEFDPDVDIDALSGATMIKQDVTKEHTN